MGTRGRPSAASLSVAVTNMPGQRPEPREKLSKAAADEWRAIVGRMPPNWFGPETFGLLESYCAHVVRSRKIEAVLAEVDPPSPSDIDGLRAYDRLTAIAEREGRAAASLANRMRLSQQARSDRDKAATMVKHETNGTRPWQRTG